MENKKHKFKFSPKEDHFHFSTPINVDKIPKRR